MSKKEDSMLQEVHQWIVDHFGKEIATIIISGTVIGRGVDMAFERHSRLSPEETEELRKSIKMLFQTAIALAQGKRGEQLAVNLSTAHITAQFKNVPPEVRALVSTAWNCILEKQMEEAEKSRNRW
jgi:hypothetical protein